MDTTPGCGFGAALKAERLNSLAGSSVTTLDFTCMLSMY